MKKCDSCGRINHGEHVKGDSCDYCLNPLFNEYGKHYTEIVQEESP